MIVRVIEAKNVKDLENKINECIYNKSVVDIKIQVKSSYNQYLALIMIADSAKKKEKHNDAC